MPAFFAHTRGAVKQVAGPWQGAPTFKLKVGDMLVGPGRLIVTQVGVEMAGNFQFVHCINDQIFVYVFGDRISELTVSGVTFSHPCVGEPGSDLVFEDYDKYKISKTGQPAVVAIGAARFQSFLTGMSFSLTDPELQLGQFSYRFHGFPTG